jgi:hypothetical protein
MAFVARHGADWRFSGYVRTRRREIQMAVDGGVDHAVTREPWLGAGGGVWSSFGCGVGRTTLGRRLLPVGTASADSSSRPQSGYRWLSGVVNSIQP